MLGAREKCLERGVDIYCTVPFVCDVQEGQVYRASRFGGDWRWEWGLTLKWLEVVSFLYF